MKFIIPILTALLAGGGVFYYMYKQHIEQTQQWEIQELENTTQAVKERFNEISMEVEKRLHAFAQTVADDRSFSLKLLVDNDRSAQEVTDVAPRFMKPMGFSFLEITDASHIILSSGHFPASVGNSVMEKAGFLSDTPVVINDVFRGTPIMSLQARKRFTIVDVPFYVQGGMAFDDSFMEKLSPREGVRVFLKHGNEMIGWDNIRSISEVNNNTIIINDKEYSAASLPLGYAGDDGAPVLIVVLEGE